MRPTNNTINDRAGAAHPLDAGAQRNTSEKAETLVLREDETVHGPYQHRNRWRLHIRGADGAERRIAFHTRELAIQAKATAVDVRTTTTVDDAVTAYLTYLRERDHIKEGTKAT